MTPCASWCARLALRRRAMPDMPRSVRIPDELWHAALAKAEERGTTLSEVVRRALERFVAKP